MIDAAVIENFSAIAERYDEFAEVQRLAARDLLALTGRPAARRILEPGCGTGLYTEMLLEAFPEAEVTAIDVAGAMIEVARSKVSSPRVRFVEADAEALTGGDYDLVTSSATFQWFEDLPGTLGRLTEMLGDGGLLTFSFFGPGTYAELDEALRGGLGEEQRVSAAGFTGVAELERMMGGCLRDVALEEKLYVQEFPSLKDLLISIKYTGTRGRRPPGARGWTPGLLARVERAYRERHGTIRATNQVLLCRGKR